MTFANQNEAITAIIEGLCFLITNRALCAAREQYVPKKGPNYIREYSEWITKLRKMRDEFENLVTGFIPQNNERIPYDGQDVPSGLKNVGIGQVARMGTAAEQEKFFEECDRKENEERLAKVQEEYHKRNP